MSSLQIWLSIIFASIAAPAAACEFHEGGMRFSVLDHMMGGASDPRWSYAEPARPIDQAALSSAQSPSASPVSPPAPPPSDNGTERKSAQ